MGMLCIVAYICHEDKTQRLPQSWINITRVLKEVISNYLGCQPSNLNERRGILTEWKGYANEL